MRARITEKWVVESAVGRVAAGCAKASADNILISGHGGGTGASPLSSTKHVGSALGTRPRESPANLANQQPSRPRYPPHRRRNSQRPRCGHRCHLRSGAVQLRHYGDDRDELVLVCKCHLNTCPVGIATTDPNPKFRASSKALHSRNGHQPFHRRR